jgi:hypothetical protein
VLPLSIPEGLPKRKGVYAVYRLRWVFDYADGKKRVGIWNGASNRFDDTCAAVNKTGIIRASIQAEHVTNYGILTAFECDGHDYASAKWVGAASVGCPIGKWKHDSYVVAPDIVGLAFLTRYERVVIYVDGSTSRRPHTDDEAKFKLREHNLIAGV